MFVAMCPGKRGVVYRGLVGRTVAMYPGKTDIVVRHASRAEVSARNAVCDLVVRGDDSEPSTTGAAQPFSRT